MSISPFLSSAEVPHAPRLAANGWRMLCCPMHMAMMLPMGMGAAVATPPSSEPPPSFLDGTAAQATEWASRGDEHTKDLFDVAEPGRWVVLRGATVWPMTGDYGLANHDILVRDGVIRAVQATGAALPEGARVIEAQGQHVIPGLADNHCHPPLLHVSAMWAGMFGPQVTAEDLQLPYDLHMFLYLSGGITRIQAMAGSAEDLTLRDSIRQGRLRGPAMRVASPVIDGYPLVWGSGISYGIGDPEGGRTAARRLRERGFDFAKPYTRLGLDAYDILLDECKALGIEVTGHIPAAVPVEHALRKGQRGVAHVFEYFYNEPESERRNLDMMARRARLSAELGVTVQSTLTVSLMFEYDIGQRPDAFKAAGVFDPVLRHLMRPGGPIVQMFSGNLQFVAQGTDCMLHSINMMKALKAEGVRIVTGTDVGTCNGTGPHTIHDELEWFVKDVGMTPLEALRCATVNSAAHHGESAVSGTLEVGKRSDLVLLNADPSRDIGATRQIAGVMLGNAYLHRAAMDRGLERAKAIFARMPVPAAA
jgi:hypothetical protein